MKQDHYLETIYNDLGRPVWFWPLVMFILFIALPLVASYVENV